VTSQVEVAYHTKVIDSFEKKLESNPNLHILDKLDIYRSILSQIDQILEYGNLECVNGMARGSWLLRRKEVEDIIAEIASSPCRWNVPLTSNSDSESSDMK
jgi:hypothetical protein